MAMKNLLAETLMSLKVESSFEAIPLIEWIDMTWVNQDTDEETDIILPPDHTDIECGEALGKLNFAYNDGYGSQWVYGRIKLRDGSWLEREEYDGSEYWTHRSVPQYSR